MPGKVDAPRIIEDRCVAGDLTRFCQQNLAETIAGVGGVQVLLRGLPGSELGPLAGHAVQSLDWYYPIAAELPTIATDPVAVAARHRQLAAGREAAQEACRAALAPEQRSTFDAVLEAAQRYAAIREEQSRDLTLGWPVLRARAARLGQDLVDRGILATTDRLHFCTRAELEAAVAGQVSRLEDQAAQRRETWERHRRSPAPVTLGQPPRLVGDVIDNAVRRARTGQVTEGALVGHPASAGRATGPVRLVHGPDDFAAFTKGEVLVARATSPAWTPLFARAAAVVTDGATLAAHASLVAREYGIPAVVGTGTATSVLRNGQLITVDGNAGTVYPLADIGEL